MLLYAAPQLPQPAVVPDAIEIDDDFDSAFEHGKAVGWNAYRAAMLQGAEPVSQPYTLPEHSPCADAADHIWLQTAGEWPASGEFSELTWSCDNQHPDDTLYVRADLVGNSPAIPDGYALVPIKLTAENGAKGVLSGEFSETKFISCPECFGDDECETCDGSGRIEITVPVSWTTIKEILAKGVEHFAAAPKQEAE
nr:molecular chaperone DnaJ [Atlantibacter hermannii]